MNDALIEDDDAATPLTPDELKGLIPSYISLRRELNEAEQAGIVTADYWAFARPRDVLDVTFLQNLHRRMFGTVWKWAGTYRTTPRNIGVAAWQIAPDVKQFLEDVRFWIEQATYPLDEIAARFHHRLVWIHPFPNGNGRFGRLATDLLARQLGRGRFSWGQDNLMALSDTRQLYIDALRAADQYDIAPLLAFMRS